MSGRGQLYFSIMKPFALLLNLVLGILQAGLNTLPPSLLNGQLHNELLVLLLSCTKGLTGLGMKVGLDPGILHSLPGYEYLLDGLHRNNS